MKLQLTPAMEHNLHDLAARSHRSAEDLALEAVEQFVAYRLELSDLVKRGNADIAAGRLLSSEEVLERIESNFAAK